MNDARQDPVKNVLEAWIRERLGDLREQILFTWDEGQGRLAPDEALLSRAITAAGIGYTIGWLEWAATHGGGPVMTKLGRTVRYRKADVLAWIETHGQRLHRTAECRSDSDPNTGEQVG